ncbi:MAG: NADH-quinone oxidoreductase subunit NuoF [Spirochaetes bacterium]|nr:NADH-quinone oxidoreductase subunit NuoF [Spirochaetota bacterium]
MKKQYIFVWEPGDKKKTALYNSVLKTVNENKLSNVEVYASRFLGFTKDTPLMRIVPDNVMYGNFTADDAPGIVMKHFVDKKPDERFLFSYAFDNLTTEEKDPHSKQFRVVLRNSGYIDPTNIDDFIRRDGYAALKKTLATLTPDAVIDEMKKSGLRGRGGAGFPTYLKWKFSKDAAADQKYIICNADEGDPGAYMDRSVLEGDPHAILEGMAIAGYTVGANQGFIYIRAEYPLAIERLEHAITRAKEKGLLGANILGTNFNFDIELRLGAGAFVCGEETALIASIEGKRGMPQPRPPFPATAGLWGKPTVINNVETWASVAPIIVKGGTWFARIGTEKSKGTKVFALTGKIKNPGLIEVPMGTSLSEIVNDIGGGTKSGKKIKAVQTGGPSGGVIPAEHLDIKVDYETLQTIGSIMGSGGMIVMDEDDCILDVVKFYLQFSVDESCGKCAPCRIGGKQLLSILTRITEGNGQEKDIADLKKIANAMIKASLCGLGQTTPNPVLSTLKYFEQEYLDHIHAHTCKAGKCKNLTRFTIVDANCIGCGACVIKCPTNAISGERKKPHVIDQLRCTKCGACYDVCKFNAVAKGA